MPTLTYYNTHAQQFFASTYMIDFSLTQNKFLDKLPINGYILDFGCGSGRDTKYFIEKGYHVDATDGSFKLCKIASQYTGIEVKHMLFEELDAKERYDGIWVCSSILHLPATELLVVMKKMQIALKLNGIIYTSFKYSNFAGERNGRYFIDMTESSFAEFLQKIDRLEIEEQWITSDVRSGRGEGKWLNLILRKK